MQQLLTAEVFEITKSIDLELGIDTEGAQIEQKYQMEKQFRLIKKVI